MREANDEPWAISMAGLTSVDRKLVASRHGDFQLGPGARWGVSTLSAYTITMSPRYRKLVWGCYTIRRQCDLPYRLGSGCHLSVQQPQPMERGIHQIVCGRDSA